MIVSIYTREGCQPCKLTKELFRKAGIDTVYLPVDDFVKEYELDFPDAKELPGVVIHNADGKAIERWTGFRHDLIKQYTG